MHPRALLAAHGIRPQKRFGQNFLMDGAIATRIARLAVDAPGDRVIEIGSGTGALTAALGASGADLTALELDPRMIEILRARDDLAGVRIETGDALAFDFASWAGAGPWRVAGNLPYNIATALLLRLVDLPHPPERIVAMIQKDVADRFLAKPGTAQYGSLTVAVGLRMSTERALNVGPAHFYPRPKVVSSVIVLRPHASPPVQVDDPATFERVVRAAFAYRRKTVANSLALALVRPRGEMETALTNAGLRPDARGETLSLADFAALTRALAL
ncbi:MAG: 16S rRNA (adenine(1518)-N(6)/adenine(1519)-N(6))-dimethyltransferase RsmA [Candidatus Velthaea sp.]